MEELKLLDYIVKYMEKLLPKSSTFFVKQCPFWGDFLLVNGSLFSLCLGPGNPWTPKPKNVTNLHPQIA